MFVVRVSNFRKFNEKIAHIEFKPVLKAFPGQFVMLNVFGYEEIPLSLASTNSVVVKAVGETTDALVNKKFEILGLRGPFGKPFTLPKNKRILLIAGGIGVAPLKFLYEVASENNDVDFVYGAKSSNELVFKFRNCVYTTEDGSFGLKGTVIDALKSLDLKSYERVYCCGREEMMKAVWKLFEPLLPKKSYEVSLERYMRCGFGVCGSCSLENGLLVCKDGPVFNAEELGW